MKNVLIIKMWALGDILMATPMIAALRAANPGVRVTWLVDSFHAELLAGHPDIDELIALDSGQWRRLLRKGNLPAWIARTRELHGQMAAHGFDAVINCQPEKWWSVYLCAAPVRVGLYPSPGLPWTRRFYTHAIARPKRVGLHNSDHFLLATQALGCPDADKRMTIGETPDEAPFAERFFREHGISDGKPFVVISPFSTAENRSWEPDLAARLADWLADAHGAHVVMTIGPKDGEKARDIVARTERKAGIIAEGTGLREYIALLRRADLIITGDSSPMHLAGALGKPYVALFGPTPAEERAPLVGEGIVLSKPLPCAPCDTSVCSNAVFRQCMKLIELADVQKAIDKLLRAPAAGRSS